MTAGKTSNASIPGRTMDEEEVSMRDVATDDTGTPALLTIAEAARLLNCSEGAVYAHLSAGRLPSERVTDDRSGVRRGRRLIPRAALEELRACEKDHPSD